VLSCSGRVLYNDTHQAVISSYPEYLKQRRSMFKSVTSHKGWNLSEEDVQSDLALEAIEEELSRVKFSSKRFCLNLSDSRLSLPQLQKVVSLMEKYDKLDVNLAFCGLTAQDVQKVLQEAKHPKWFEQGRVMMAATPLERSIERFIADTQKRLKGRKDWQDVEDSTLEPEVTKAVQQYLACAGYSNIEPVPLTNVYGVDGSVLVEVDELLSACGPATDSKARVLITVEAKHEVTTGKIDDREKQNDAFAKLLVELRSRSLDALDATGACSRHLDCCAVLRLYAFAEVQHYLGGVHFPEPVMDYARKKNFNVVTCGGGAFSVIPTKPQGRDV